MRGTKRKSRLKAIATVKLRFDRGYYWSKYIRDLGLGILVLRELELPLWLGIIAVPSMYIVGYIDERYGIWKMEQKLSYEKIGQMKKALFK